MNIIQILLLFMFVVGILKISERAQLESEFKKTLNSKYYPKMEELTSRYIALYEEKGITIQVNQVKRYVMFRFSYYSQPISEYATRKYTTENKNHILKDLMKLSEVFYLIDVEYGTDFYHSYMDNINKIWEDYILKFK